MPRKAFFTTREIAELCGAPVWLVRRVVDRLGEEIPRVGLYRLVPAALLDRVQAELRKRGRAEVPSAP
jgi:hypothetical protein